MRIRTIMLMALLVFILIPNVMFAGIYKCIDGDGNATFVTEPKSGCTLLGGSADSERLALLIGNSNYGRGSNLPNPVNDVRAMKRALEGLGFKVIKHENCTQREMKMAMDDFGSKLKGQDVGLFFYAGHGVQVSQYNYLVPVDARLTSEKKVEYNCVRADRVLAEMEGAGSKTNIVILDACRDNPFERSWRRGGGAGLAFMNAPSGSLIAYSTAPGKTALDGGGRNSPYTSALLQHIDIPNTTIIEMFQGVRSTVITQSGGKQTPWESTSLRGNFYFTKEGSDTRVNDELAILKGERQELKKLRSEIERKQRESEEQKVEAISVPQKPSPNTTKNFDEAVALTDKASDLMYSSDSDGNPYWLSGEFEVIVNILNRAINLAPVYGHAYSFRADVYQCRAAFQGGGTEIQDYNKAVKDYTKAIQLNPASDTNYVSRGDTYRYLGQYPKAMQDYAKAIQINPTKNTNYSARGDSHASLGQYSKAIKDYNKAIQLNPKDGSCYYHRARIFFDWGKTEEACADLQKLCELGACKAIRKARKAGFKFPVSNQQNVIHCPSSSTSKMRVRARHILIRVASNATEQEREDALKKIKEVQEKQKKGHDFIELAKKYSQGRSSTRGGDVGYFKLGTMVPAFEEAAFKLEPGEVSDIVKTQFGYHLIKVIDKSN